MKTYLILCILLASLLFFPSSLLARDLAAGTVTPAPSNPDKQAKLCGGKGKTYKCPRPPPCRSKYGRNCAPPNSSP
ncbi:hypothetical protein TIFTF001_043277 [Ficus carica]|uniref:Uncharacterized protein n=1 Tax=Ficus carica TaxID=3494 RepID=A0AA87YR55_FICCA|nr:hypothetical protein TIFTF001_043277 [Ficus carica]